MPEMVNYAIFIDSASNWMYRFGRVTMIHQYEITDFSNATQKLGMKVIL